MAAPTQSLAGSFLAGLGLVVTLLLGSVWIGFAVYNGQVGQVLARFLVAVGAGLFYLVLMRVARDPRY